MKVAIILGVVLLIALVNAQAGGQGGRGDKGSGGRGMGKPKAPTRPEKGKRPPKPSNAKQGRKGRMEFNLTSINHEVIVWPKGCTFALRKLNCSSEGESCKPLIFALDGLKELESCGGKEVGKAPGKNKRKRGADRDALKKLQCIVQSTESCMLPDSTVDAVCVNASAYISDESYFSFNLYVALENGTFTYLGQSFDIAKGQTKMTLSYVGTTCCSGDESCSCEDGVTGALDVSLRIVSPPGGPRNNPKGQGRAKINEIAAGDAMMEFPNIVDVDNTTVEISDFDIKSEGADTKISMCIKNVSNYFIYDPTVQTSNTAESSDITINVDSDFGDDDGSSGATGVLFTATGCIIAAALALMMH